MIENSSYILVLPDIGIEPKGNDIRCKLNRALNQKVPIASIQDVQSKTGQDDKKEYTEYMLHLECDFEGLNEQWLVGRFSEFNVFEGLGESWLSCDSVFNWSNLHSYHRDVNLLEFGFGSLVGLNRFVEHYSSSWSDKSVGLTQLKMKFEHHEDKMQIYFVVGRKNVRKQDQDGRTNRLHYMEISYSFIKRILIDKKHKSDEDIHQFDVYLQMVSAPILKKVERQRLGHKRCKFDVVEKYDDLLEDSFRYVGADDETVKTNYMREVDFGKKFDSDSEDEGPNKVIPLDPSTSSAFCSGKTMGMCRVLKLKIQGRKDDRKGAWDAVEQLVACCRTKSQVFFTSMKTVTTKKEVANPSVANKHFDTLYALKCITTTSYQIADELWLRNETEMVNNMMQSYSDECPEALQHTLYDIYSKMEKGDVIRFRTALEKIYQSNMHSITANKDKQKLPNQMVLMKRAVLTPSRFFFIPPVPQMKSFLLRNSDAEYAMRVTVRDDNFDQLTFTNIGTPKHKIRFLMKHIGDKLCKGFKIGKRFYQYFGSSTSQLREHGCFFFAMDGQGRDAEFHRQSVGDVHAITNVPKFMARLGQSLSQAKTSIKLPREWVEGPIEDIMCKDKKYNFSDGIGKISRSVAEMIYASLELEDDDKPSAFQIRYGGCKGMLVLDPTLTGNKVIFRKSQWKFDSDQDSLEVLKMSKPQNVSLNRQFVSILEQLGLPTEVFSRLQAEAFRNLIGSLVNSSDACNILKLKAVLRLPYTRLHHCGIDFSTEPFFKPMVMCLYKSSLTKLKQKANIPLPFSESRTMFGVLDETYTLEYGQVFFQYTNITIQNKVSRYAQVHTGTVLITKNPCMHPGDVRKFQAVDVPALHHIKDCLVFPAKGPRPHPDEMAGSDLDGDEYCVIWYKDLFFDRENYDAMDYSNDVKPVKNVNIKVKDMTRFMCTYIDGDQVGLIANAHLAISDLKGIFDPVCMSIAKKYSVTLDFAKSGQPEQLKYEERAAIYPDFMEKNKHKATYLSARVLGELFRNCKRIELVSEMLSDEIEVTVDPSLIYPGWEEYEEDAKDALKEYQYLLFTPTKLFNSTKEGEIMTGTIKKIESTSFMGKNAKENLEMALDCIIPGVFRQMRDRFLSEFLKAKSSMDLVKNRVKSTCSLSKNPRDLLAAYIQTNFNEYYRDNIVAADDVLQQMFKKISAWYIVAYRDKKEASGLGLPWTMSELLGLLKAKQTGGNAPVPKIEIDVKAVIDEALRLTDYEEDCLTESGKASVALQQWIAKNEDIIAFRGGKVSELIRAMDIRLKEVILGRYPELKNASQMVITFLREESLFCCLSRDPDKPNIGISWVSKELGLLAVVALSNLASSGKMWFRDGETDVARNILTREYRETIRFPIDLGKKMSNYRGHKDQTKDTKTTLFHQLMTKRQTDVEETLKSYARLKSLTSEYIETRMEGLWYVTMTVYGKVWNIELLKDFVIQRNFVTKLDEMVKKYTNPL